MMKFKKLQASDIQTINTMFLERRKLSRSKGDVEKTLAEMYNVSTRSIRKWVKRLSLRTVNTSLDAEPIISTEKSPAKILILDIETAPLKSYVWGIWNVNLGHSLNMLEHDWFMLTWSAKWLFDPQIFSDKLKPEEVFAEDDSRIVKSVWALLDEADVVIAHNGLKFDIKRMNTRFLKHKLNPPMPFQVIDTLVHCRKQFNIISNKLDYIGKFLGLGQKQDTGGFDLWKGCMNGDLESLSKMEIYNIKDVTLLEDIYLAIRNYIKPHPNMGLFIEDNVQCCPTCSSTDISWGGSYATYANVYDAFRCSNCGAVGRSRTTKITKESRKQLTISVP